MVVLTSCMYVGGCKSHFTKSALIKALPMKLIEKFDNDKLQTMEMARLTDLCCMSLSSQIM